MGFNIQNTGLGGKVRFSGLMTGGFSARYFSPTAPAYLLDTYSGAAAAYSLRKLSTAYTGSAIRVRRDFDNFEQNIGFDVNGNLDTGSLQTFVGYQNLTGYSGNFTAADWVKTGFTTSVLNVTGSSGTVTITTFTENTSNSIHGTYPTNGYKLTNASGQYTAAIVLKQGTRRYLLFGYDNGTVPISIVVDTLNWTVTNVSTTGAISTSGIQNLGGGLYRVYVTGTISGTNTIGCALYGLSTSASNSTTYTGNGSTIIAGEVQLNQGSLQPYQQTTNAFRTANGFVTTWYDQSGNVRNATQTTAGNQPRIMAGGVVETILGKPCLYFYTSAAPLGSFNLSSAISGAAPFTSFYPTKIDNTTSGISPYFSSTGSGVTPYTVIELQTANYFIAQSGTTLYRGGTPNTNYKLLTGLMPSSGIPSIFVNGTSLGTLISGSDGNSTNLTSIGGRTDLGIRLARVPEMVLYKSDQTVNRIGIESNINSYYNIY